MANDLSVLNGKAIAITGGHGYIGSALAEALKEYTDSVLRVTRRGIPNASDTLQADIRAASCWKEIVDRAEIIFHLAGNTSVYAAAKDPAGSLNSSVLPVSHLIAAAQATGRRPRVVFASTATVHGLTDKLPVSESDPASPTTIYDLHKLFAEMQLALATKQGILESVALRLANVYGPSLNSSAAEDRGILNKIARMALQGENLRIYGHGNYLRDYVYIDDVVRAFLLASITKGVAGERFLVAGGVGVAVKNAFQLVADQAAMVTGRKVRIEHVDWPAGADLIERRNFVADITVISDKLKWTPEVDLENGIRRLIEANNGTNQNI
jgi:nucleoside-diphosphate-sugar epimerase